MARRAPIWLVVSVPLLWVLVCAFSALEGRWKVAGMFLVVGSISSAMVWYIYRQQRQ